MIRTMDPALIRQLLEGEADIITPTARADAELFKAARCPVCGNVGADKILPTPKVVITENGQPAVVRSAFSPVSPIPQGYAQCMSCKTQFDFKTGLIHRQGDGTSLALDSETFSQFGEEG